MLQFKYRLYIQILLVWQFRMPFLHLSWASSAPKLRYFLMIIFSSSFFLSILCKYWYNVNISKYSSFKIVVTYWERLAWMMDEWMDGWFSTPLCLHARSLQRYCRLLDEVPKATEFRGWEDALFVHYVVFLLPVFL